MNKCFKWKLNDQWATPKNIYNYFMERGYMDFNPLCEYYEDSLQKEFDSPVHNHCEKGFYQICGVVRKGKYCYFYEG